MNSTLRIRLNTTPEQGVKLQALQVAFAEVCNALAPLVQRTGCWNRVALHHLAYREMRQRFPGMGSQMICNALYSVSRASRFVYQHPQSPFNLQRLQGRPLPLLNFLPRSPVYFDRHTLSLKDGLASMYTLDGRMRFNLPLAPDDERRFRTARLREIVMLSLEDRFELQFSFSEADPADGDEDGNHTSAARDEEMPEHVVVIHGSAQAAGQPSGPFAPHPSHTSQPTVGAPNA